MLKKIDISSLYFDHSDDHKEVDNLLYSAASELGFAKITGIPNLVLSKKIRKKLLSIFDLPDEIKRKLYRWNFNKSNKNIYRGWFPVQDGLPTYKEGIDIGPDILRFDHFIQSDPLTEPTPLPDESILPGWRKKVQFYYETMELTGKVIMRSLSRSLKINNNFFDKYFEKGISTLRLLHYPIRDEKSFLGKKNKLLVEDGYSVAKPHIDSGFLTLLAQDEVHGLQAQSMNKKWFDILPEDETLVLNFGLLLQKWTSGKILATTHRVIGYGVERFSIPFFLEPSVESLIKPLHKGINNNFKPFYYGDYLWDVTTRFVEQKGIKHLRKK